MRIVNCARGGLIDEAALKDALDSGHVAGAALDVFESEPAKASPLFGTPNFISTPHLGASTSEAQVNVAIQVAEQMSDFLLLGGVTNAINMPSLTAEEAPRLKPYMALAEKLGKLVGQIVGEDVRSVSVEVEGAAAAAQPEADHRRGAGRADGHLFADTVNMVNAPFLAKERGLDVREVRHDREGDYHTLVARHGRHHERRPLRSPAPCSATRRRGWSRCSGSRSRPSSTGTMIYIVNTDAPGFIGKLGTALGEAGINIATFNLGRRAAGGEAVALVVGRRRSRAGRGANAVPARRRARGRAAEFLKLRD